MPSYQTRVLTARDRQLLDALEKDPRYRKLAQQLRGPPKPVEKPQGKAVQAPQPAAEPDLPSEPEKPPTGRDSGIVGPSVPKPSPRPHFHHKPSDR
jgi:hypothetical protein